MVNTATPRRNGRGKKETMISNIAEAPSSSRAAPQSSGMPDATVRDLVRVFKLLSDETRLRILLYLTRQKELHVRALCDILGQSQPAVSHHLALLRMAELIEPRREGKHNYYHIVPQRFEQLLDTVFSAVPKQQRSIRFEDYVLSYAPAERAT
jgi:ArsR family transcriptional regulator, arsenate/arsenite/antimonite-responsive transcriptional repressor